jgi:hypothetical protein
MGHAHSHVSRSARGALAASLVVWDQMRWRCSLSARKRVTQSLERSSAWRLIGFLSSGTGGSIPSASSTRPIVAARETVNSS